MTSFYNNNSTGAMVHSPSFESLGSCNISLDDISCRSMKSADVALDLLESEPAQTEFSLPPQKVSFDVTFDDDESVLEIDEPLENLGVVEPIGQPVQRASASLMDVFSPEQEFFLLEEVMAGQGPAFSGFAKDIPSLMRGELLELQSPMPVTESPGVVVCIDDDDDEEDEYAAAAVARVEKQQQPPVAPVKKQQRPLQRSEEDAITRIMRYLHYTERDRYLVQRAAEIVKECHRLHQKGKKRKYRNNLSGAIFEGLVGLMGGQKFNEVYHNSLNFDPSAYGPVYNVAATQPLGPDTLQVAIAYGMHIARLNQMDASGNDPASQMRLVQQGVQSFNSMNVEEREMFWNYATKHSA